MDPETLSRVGNALYGPHWIAELAKHTNRTRLTVTRYRNGERAIPVEFSTTVSILVAERCEELIALKQDLGALGHYLRGSNHVLK